MAWQVFPTAMLSAQLATGEPSLSKADVVPSYFPKGEFDERKERRLTEVLRSNTEPSLLDYASQPTVSSFRLIINSPTSRMRLRIIRLRIGTDGKSVLYSKSIASGEEGIILEKEDVITPNQAAI